MLMMRSTAPTKMAKPPPPVPPRPSKDIIAEALAKTRKMSPEMTASKTKPTPPARTAPPPLLKQKPFPHMFNENCNSRTVVFQSSVMKTSKIEVTLTRSERTHAAEPAEGKHVEKGIAAAESTEECKEINDSDDTKTSLICNSSRNPAENVVNTLIDEMCLHANNKQQSEDVDKCLQATLSENAKIISVSTETLDKIANDKNIAAGDDTTSGERSVLVIESLSGEDNKHMDSNLDGYCSTERKDTKHVTFNDKRNHEFLIAELENMKKEQERIMKRQRKPSLDLVIAPNSNDTVPDSSEVPPKTKIQHSDWVEVDNGKEVRLSSCQITIDDSANAKSDDDDDDVNPTAAPRLFRSFTMSSLHGLPPLPKSLSSFNVLDNQRSDSRGTPTPSRTGTRGNTPPTPGCGTVHVVYPPHPRSNGSPGDSTKKNTTLDSQLAILRREMYGLRQLDLSLLSQLWSLNEAIQDFRQILQDQEENALSPPSPSQSSGEDGEGDEFYTPSPLKFRPAPPPPPLRRASNSSSATSSEYGVSLQ